MPYATPPALSKAAPEEAPLDLLLTMLKLPHVPVALLEMMLDRIEARP